MSTGQVGYALLTHSPVAGGVLLHPDAPRLACVKPVASVHPEPGSNSPLYNILRYPTILCRHSAKEASFIALAPKRIV